MTARIDPTTRPPREAFDRRRAQEGDWIEEYVDLVQEITEAQYPKILSHMEDESPNECVGLLWMDGQVQRLINQARSSSRFSISQPQLAERLAEMDETNVLVCVYHSHPAGSTTLSWDDKRSLKRQWDRDLVIPWLVVTSENAALWYILDQDQELFVSRSVGRIGSND